MVCIVVYLRWEPVLSINDWATKTFKHVYCTNIFICWTSQYLIIKALDLNNAVKVQTFKVLPFFKLASVKDGSRFYLTTFINYFCYFLPFSHKAKTNLKSMSENVFFRCRPHEISIWFKVHAVEFETFDWVWVRLYFIDVEMSYLDCLFCSAKHIWV